MADVTLLGIQPENEKGRQFETDAETWLQLRKILLVAGLSYDAETAAGLLCVKNNARCDAEQAKSVCDQLEFLVESLDRRDVVVATAVSWWRDGDFMDSVDLFENPDMGVSVETIGTLLGFLQGSQGFVIRSQIETPTHPTRSS